jgi:hypothetical protein
MRHLVGYIFISDSCVFHRVSPCVMLLLSIHSFDARSIGMGRFVQVCKRDFDSRRGLDRKRILDDRHDVNSVYSNDV